MVKAGLPHLSWWNADAPYHDKSSIWVKSVVGSSGFSIDNPTLLARGLTYNGVSTGRELAGGRGFCVDAKRGARVELEVFYRDQNAYYHHKRNIRLRNTPSSCERNPGDGIVIEKIEPRTFQYTCARGRLLVDDGNTGVPMPRNLRAEFIPTSRKYIGRYSVPLTVNGEIHLDRLPANVKGKVRISLSNPLRAAGKRLVLLESSSSNLDTGADSGSSCRKFDDVKLSWSFSRCAEYARKKFGAGSNACRPRVILALKDGQRIKGCLLPYNQGGYRICNKDSGIITIPRSSVSHVEY